MSSVLAFRIGMQVIMVSDGQITGEYGRIEDMKCRKCFSISNKVLMGVCGDLASTDYFKEIIYRDEDAFLEAWKNRPKLTEYLHDKILKVTNIFGKEREIRFVFMDLVNGFSGGVNAGAFYLNEITCDYYAEGSEVHTATILLEDLYSKCNSTEVRPDNGLINIMEKLKNINIYIGGKIFMAVLGNE